MAGTNIEKAYFDCEKVSASLGGISVETAFNGVEMFYYRQPLGEWKDEYKKAVYGPSNDFCHGCRAYDGKEGVAQ